MKKIFESLNSQNKYEITVDYRDDPPSLYLMREMRQAIRFHDDTTNSSHPLHNSLTIQ